MVSVLVGNSEEDEQGGVGNAVPLFDLVGVFRGVPSLSVRWNDELKRKNWLPL
jgi:hypothetical protein